MELTTYIIFGIFFLLIVCLLYIPIRWIAKRKLVNPRTDSILRLHITSSGFALITLMVFSLILGSFQKVLAPQTEFGKFVNTNIGMISFWVIVTLLFIVFGYFLQMIGYKLFRKSNEDR